MREDDRYANGLERALRIIEEASDKLCNDAETTEYKTSQRNNGMSQRRKTITIDWQTRKALAEFAKRYGLTDSQVIRLAVWKLIGQEVDAKIENEGKNDDRHN